MQCGTTQQWIEEFIEADSLSLATAGLYTFKTSNNKRSYYPINNTIVEEL